MTNAKKWINVRNERCGKEKSTSKEKSPQTTQGGKEDTAGQGRMGSDNRYNRSYNIGN
jgi:hypothetical protein